jgi:hypothetical protein
MSYDFNMAERIDALNNVLFDALAEEFPLMAAELDRYRDADDNMDVGGLINARRVTGKFLREALKSGVVLADPPRAKIIAHNGAAGHYDAAADLQPLGTITVPPDLDAVRLP